MSDSGSEYICGYGHILRVEPVFQVHCNRLQSETQASPAPRPFISSGTGLGALVYFGVPFVVSVFYWLSRLTRQAH